MGIGSDDVPRQLEELHREIAELRASRKRIALIDDAERRSIENAFHEGVQQQLVGLAANTQLVAKSVDVDPASAKALLAAMGRDIAITLEGARALAGRIYPPLLAAGGLGPSLRMAAAAAGIPTRIDVPTGTVIRPEIASTVYFCCLDVFEHVRSGTQVSVTLREEGTVTSFEIVVNGDLDTERLSVRDRIEAQGGRLSIDSGAAHKIRLLGSVRVSE